MVHHFLTLGPPSPPENVSILYTTENSLLINISWSATSLMGVHQNYTIFFDTYYVLAVTTNLYYLYLQNSTDSTINCAAFIQAVNSAGASSPSENVSIPSLPDIGPVTASLTIAIVHHVRHFSEGAVVNVSFDVSNNSCSIAI